MSYESIVAGTEVQNVKEVIEKAQNELIQRISEVVGAEAAPNGFDTEPFNQLNPAIETLRLCCAGVIQWKIERIVHEAEQKGEA